MDAERTLLIPGRYRTYVAHLLDAATARMDEDRLPDFILDPEDGPWELRFTPAPTPETMP